MKGRAIVSTLVCALFACATAAEAWTPPIGIPAPPFGINETAPPDPNPWTTPTPGFYYVDATQPTATDTNNPYGTPALPRMTIPIVLPAGSVVELHGTYDADHTSPNGILSQGTAAKPVFIRGASATSRPLIRNGWEVSGTYYILENLQFADDNGVQTGYLVILAPTNYAALRSTELSGNLNAGGLAVASWDASLTENVVVYQTYIHDNGDVNATYDQDVHGIAVSANVDHLWVVDSQMARNSGDGIQINAGSAAAQATTNHIYVGRNTSYANKQTGFWSKQAVDVIFSQNECYDHHPSNSSFGQCMGYQYATDWIWFLFNHVHDSDFGIAASDDSGLGTGTQAYYIGNVIHAIHTTDPSTYNPATSWSNAAIMLAGGVNRYVINNTIYDVDAGVNVPASNGTLEIGDNIIADVTVAAANHVFVEQQSLANVANLHHDDLFGNPRIDAGGTVYDLTAAQLATFQSTGGDPQFVNPTGLDFSLLSGSAAIDTGETNAVYAAFQQRYGLSIQFDRRGIPRPQGAAMDLGAYEFTRAPAPPAGVRFVPQADWLAWDPDATGDTAGYVVSYGTAAGSYTTSIDVGNQNRIQIDGLTNGATYYFAVRGYPAGDHTLLSPYSAEVSGVPQFTTNAFGLPDPIDEGSPTGVSTLPSSTSSTLLPQHDVAVIFQAVTGSGSTWANVTENPRPSNAGAGWSTWIYQIGTSASTTGPVTVGIAFDPAILSPRVGTVKLVGASTTGVDLSNHIVWGTVASLPTTVMVENDIVDLTTDFNADGRGDLLWRSTTTGALVAWLMNGSKLLSTPSVTPTTVSDLNWVVVGSGDFNGDGHPDILWRDAVTGALSVWYMNGTIKTSVVMLNPSSVSDMTWRIVGVADFDGDGQPDLLWQNDVSGLLCVWYMNGVSLRAVAMLNPSSVVDTSWKIVGVGDFDLDGHPDIVWRNSNTGLLCVWFMNGVNERSVAMLNPSSVADLNWQIDTVTDVDGDGHPDLVWRNGKTGMTVAWLMNGVNQRAAPALGPGYVVLNWNITSR